VSEWSCGACAGIGHVPAAGAKSLRAFNRNFPGRRGVKDDSAYLCSSTVAAASALTGVITDPRTLGAPTPVTMPPRFALSTVGFVEPDGTGEIPRGPNIKPVPLGEPVAETLEAPVVIKLGDKISTDDISPAGSAVLVFRSNIPAISEFTFKYVDAEFATRARGAGRSVIVAGELYGQGSSREAAATGPMYLGVRAVIVKSFGRRHTRRPFMSQQKIRAVYMRGGTSRCLVFHQGDLPAAGAARDRVLSGALGSPDPYGRQLDGLGGGISSLSKAVIIGPPTLPGADVDYTFAQVEVKRPAVDYAGNCGNCSSSVGPFAIDEALVPSGRDGETIGRI